MWAKLARQEPNHAFYSAIQPMTISCPNCGKSGSIKSRLPRGAKVRCKGCDRSFEPVTSQEWSGLALAGGRYRVTAKLGEGGMGFVYRALDQNIDSDVVIKVPRQAMMDDPEFAGRFTREIRSLVKLSHPHIVKVTDVGNYDEIPFAVMQYLAGGSLEDQRPVASSGQVLPCDPKRRLDRPSRLSIVDLHAEHRYHRARSVLKTGTSESGYDKPFDTS